MANDDEIKALNARIAELALRIGLMEDTHAVRTLHFKYGYYIDKCLYDEAVDLFADDARLHFLNGVYRGKAGARRLYCEWFRNFFTRGYNGPTYGFLLDHLQMQDIVDVAADGLTAKGRFRALMTAGQHESKRDRIEGFPAQCWEGGTYENSYVKERGVWKIQVLNYNMIVPPDFQTAAALPSLARTVATISVSGCPTGPFHRLTSIAQRLYSITVEKPVVK